MNKILSCLVTFSIAASCIAQPVFQESYGGLSFESLRSVVQTSDGEFIAAGDANSFGNGNFDMYVVKTNPLGDTVWTTVLGGSNDDRAIAVQEVAPGKYLVSGYTQSFGAGNYDVFMAMLDASGDTLFTRAYGDTLLEYTLANSAKVERTYEGGFIIAATTYTTSMSSMHVYVVKTDSIGNLVWAKEYAGVGVERAWCIQKTNDSAYVISGVTTSNLSGSGDVFILKIDGDGNIIWGKTYESPGNDEGVSLTVRPNGDIVVFATCNGFNVNGYNDILVFRTDMNGTLLWSKTYSGAAQVTYVNSGTADVNGDLIIAGALRTVSNDFSALAIKTNNNGDTIWTRVIGGSGGLDYYNSVYACFSGSYMFAGVTDSYGAGNMDGVLTMIGLNGEVTCNRISPAINVTTVSLNTGTFAPAIINRGIASYSSPAITRGGQTSIACFDFVGMQDQDNETNISLFPNPVSTSMTVWIEPSVNDTGESRYVEITDAFGNIISNQTFIGNSVILDFSGRAPGIYFVRIRDNDRSDVRKIVVGNQGE